MHEDDVGTDVGRASTERVHALLRGAILATDHTERYRLLDEVGQLGVEAERDLPLLVELLDRGHHWFARSLAVWEIGKLGPSAARAVPQLASLAGEDDVIIDPRWASLWALERLGPASAPAAPAVIDILRGDQEPDMRSQAAYALGAIGVSDGIVAALAEAFADDDSLVREAAATSCGRIGPEARAAADGLERLAASDGIRPVREQAVRSLRRLGEHARAGRHESASQPTTAPAFLPGLLERLASDDPRTRAESTWPLGKLGADAAPGLDAVVRQLRTDHDPDARWGAGWVVGRIGAAAAPAVGEVALALRDDPDPDVRAQAAHALGHMGPAGAPATPMLAAALDDRGASLLREEAALALGRIGPAASEAVLPLRRRLLDPHPLVRTRAEVALASIQGIG